MFILQRAAAERILRQLQEHPDTWTRVVTILQNSGNLNSKFYALQVLEGVIKYRWNALPMEQRDGIKNYISDLIVQVTACHNYTVLSAFDHLGGLNTYNHQLFLENGQNH